MKQWYAKELSQLTKVSVRTLHYYDKIELLRPSMRLSNGYRLYSEKDLLRLQQIIALKFFGFELNQIKVLLAKQDNILESFALQSKVLQERADALQEASVILKRLIDCCGPHESIPWENIVQSIEVYHMIKQIEHAWVKEIFTPDELEQYAEFEKEIKLSEKKSVFEKNWQQLVNELKSNLQNAPDSPVGIDFGRQWMDWVNGLYGKKYAHLRTKKWEQGFGEGKGLDEIGLAAEEMDWIEKAVDAYWADRIAKLLNQIGDISSDMILMRWHEILDEMYGDDIATKNERQKLIIKRALNEKHVSQAAKDWLKTLLNPC